MVPVIKNANKRAKCSNDTYSLPRWLLRCNGPCATQGGCERRKILKIIIIITLCMLQNGWRCYLTVALAFQQTIYRKVKTGSLSCTYSNNNFFSVQRMEVFNKKKIIAFMFKCFSSTTRGWRTQDLNILETGMLLYCRLLRNANTWNLNSIFIGNIAIIQYLALTHKVHVGKCQLILYDCYFATYIHNWSRRLYLLNRLSTL